MQQEISYPQLVRFILEMMRPFPMAICIMSSMSIFWAIDLSLRPYILKIILDRLSSSPAVEVFSMVGIFAIIYLLLSVLSTAISRLYGYFVEIKMIPDLRKKVSSYSIDKLLTQSHSFYQNQFSGSLANKVSDLAGYTPDIIQIVIDRFFSSLLALVFAIFTLWQVNVYFALLMLFWSLLFVMGSLFISKHLTLLADSWSDLGTKITGKIVDTLSNILSVRLFARKRAEKEYLGEVFDEAVKAEQDLQWLYFWIWLVYGLSFSIILGLNLYLLLEGRREGQITIGDFALVLSIDIAIVDFLWMLTRDFSQFSRSLGRVTQALRIIMASPEIVDKPGAKSLSISNGEIVFDQVGFRYKGGDTLFQNKSVIIQPGQKVGLVGYSGSGKTTFVNLILRIYDITSGQIKIDNQDIRDITQESLRRAIGLIPQDPSLFHRTLLENIRYGRLDATDEEVKQAAIRANAHDFIEKLPQGYYSLVGERGVKLSGGQRQRIAIARAILKNAPILILDEATSHLDSLTEAEIQESLWQLMQYKTTIVVAHRLSTLLHMDRILVFKNGVIIQDGSHQELSECEGLYQQLWEAQVGGFLRDEMG